MKTKVLIVFALLVCSAVFAQQGTHTKKISARGVRYWEYLPPGHSPADVQKYPLMIFLHGCGDIAYRKGRCKALVKYTSDAETELEKVLNDGPPKLIRDGSNMCFTVNNVQQCFIVISPQLNNGGGMPEKTWEWTSLDAFIEEVKTAYPSADLKRVYLTGLSLGGIGTWRYAQRHPSKLAAIVPISGNTAGDPPDLACNIKKLPVWAFHDDPDGDVNEGGTINMEKRIKACPDPVLLPMVTMIKNYSIDPNGGPRIPKDKHNAWVIAYSNNPSPADTPTRELIERPDPVPAGMTIYTWMLSHSRTALGPIANAEANKDVTSSNATIGSASTHPEATSTIQTYFWELASKSPESPTPTLTNQTSPILSVSNMGNGKYTFRLTVTDNLGYIDTDESFLTVRLATTNNPPVANAGADKNITLPQNSTMLTGSGTDSDGTIAAYAWTKLNGGAATLANTNTPTLSISNLSAGSYTFRLTVTDDDNASASDEVTVSVSNAPTSGTAMVWNSYDIVMQPNQVQQQSIVNSTDGSTPATVSFYQSTDVGGVDQGELFSVYREGSFSVGNVATYWAKGTGVADPHVGKSTVPRGGDVEESNVPSPNGVFDLQMRPPNLNNLVVSAFAVPVNGSYSISNIAGRRVMPDGIDSRIKIFNSSKALIFDLELKTGQPWVQSATILSLGNLVVGDKIYFAVDRDGTSFASDFTEVAWTISSIPANASPVADAGIDKNIILPQNSTTLIGSGTDSDGTIEAYAWTQLNGGAATLANANTSTLSISNLTAGTYTFRLTVTDNDNATATDDVTIVVADLPEETVWNSYDIVMQPNQVQQQSIVNSTDGSTPATVSFYQSTDVGGVNQAELFSVYRDVPFSTAGSNVATYWAKGTGVADPHVGKSTVPRGGDVEESNVPSPNGVFDLQMRPPNLNNLVVSAFTVPVTGSYSISNIAGRRVMADGIDSRIKIFNSSKVLIFDLELKTGQPWVQSPTTLSLGNLVVGDKIYFAVDRDGTSFASDFTEVAWTVTRTTTSSGANARLGASQEVSSDELKSNERSSAEETVTLYPNPVKSTIHFDGLAGEGDVKIYNAMGKLLQQTQVNQDNKSLELTPGRFHYGFYFMSLETTGTIKYYKFLKE